MLIQHTASAPVLRGLAQSDDISISTTSAVVYSGSPEYTADALVSGPGGLGAVVHTITVTSGALGGSGQIQNKTPSAAALSGNVLTSIGSGIAAVGIQGVDGEHLLRLPALARIGDAYIPGQYKAGSLAHHVNSLMLGFVAGKTPSNATLQVYTGSPATNNLTPNPTRIAPELDMSWQEVCHGLATSPYTDWYGPCSLITNRHALVATHFRPGIGDTCTFRSRGGVIQTAVIQGMAELGGDCSVFYFDREITDCAVAKLVSQPVLEAKAPNLYGKPMVSADPPIGTQAYGFPIFFTLFNSYQTQGLADRRKLMIVNLYSWAPQFGGQLGASIYPHAPFREWSVLGKPGDPNSPDNIRPNDSGSAAFMPVIEPGQSAPTCVLLFAAWTPAGPDYGNRITAINTALNTLAGTPQGTYSVQQADLSAFTSF